MICYKSKFESVEAGFALTGAVQPASFNSVGVGLDLGVVGG